MAEREYKDSEGNVVTLDKLVRIEPEWAANIIRWYEGKLEKRTAALRESVTAIDDWIRTTAPEHCGADHLAETYNRISSNGGTLAYAAALQAKNREALSDEWGKSRGSELHEEWCPNNEGGHSSMVEHLASNQGVAGSSPAGRSMCPGDACPGCTACWADDMLAPAEEPVVERRGTK